MTDSTTPPPSSWPCTLRHALSDAQRRLRDASISSPRLDAELLLMHALHIERETLYTRLPDPVSSSDLRAFHQLIERRLNGVPVAYLTGYKHFYGRRFLVSPDVLIPRPETEYLVQWVLDFITQHATSRRLTIVDVGTGSGAIALSTSCELGEHPHLIVGSDASARAVSVAARNRDYLSRNVEFVVGSLLEWCGGPVDVILANLPYLRQEQEHHGIREEPWMALFADEEGFALNRALIDQAESRLAGDGALIMEIDPAQHDLALTTARTSFPGCWISVEHDLAGLHRYLIVKRTH